MQYRKMRFYFEDWGCLKCEKKGLVYGANGMCDRCAQTVQHRVARCLQERCVKSSGTDARPEMCVRVQSAKELLSDLVVKRG